MNKKIKAFKAHHLDSRTTKCSYPALHICCYLFCLCLLVTLLMITGCTYKLCPGTYRFAAEFDAAATAYRNVLQDAEQLAITVKLRNLSDREIYYAKPFKDDKDKPGLYISAKLLTDNQYIRGREGIVVPGLRAGYFIRNLQNEHRGLLFDRHQWSVDKLSESAPALLNLDADNIQSNFRLFGNELLFQIIFPIEWNKVENSPLVVETQLELEILLHYRNPDMTELTFEKSCQHRIRAYLVNARRGNVNLSPAGCGPQSGEFKPTTP